MKQPLKMHLFVGTLMMSSLACRPVMTIGWQEILILVVVIAVLIGPALFRLYRRWDEFRNWRDNRDKD